MVYDEAVAALFARRPGWLVRGLDRASAMTDQAGLVVVTGSLYIVGAARDALGLDVT